jgi:iron complex transport system ATP-binding protein
LLRLLAADIAPAAGSIAVNGRPLREWTAGELARVRAVLPQSESLRFSFTVSEVVALGRLPAARHGAAREAQIVRDALAAAGVAEFASRAYPTLSAGERARVQFARVLAQIWEPVESGPRHLLLDEPTASLDLLHQHEVLATTRAFAQAGIGVVAVLHDPNLALLYADRAVLLENGRVVADGPARDVLTPARVESVFGIAVDALPRPGSDAPWLAAHPRVMPAGAPRGNEAS